MVIKSNKTIKKLHKVIRQDLCFTRRGFSSLIKTESSPHRLGELMLIEICQKIILGNTL